MITLKKNKSVPINLNQLPEHIAIIMDGNGRWAKSRGLLRSAGHAAGCETFRKIGTYCKDIGIKYLTVYAFSTENWKRPAEEVEGIMRLFRQYLYEAIEKMVKDNIAIHVLGDYSLLSPELMSLINQVEELSKTITSGLQTFLCINYGGRADIVHAAKQIAEAAKAGTLDISKLDETLFSNYLYTNPLPDPDIIIRPGGEMRVSNFLLWQSAYSEY
ncbi:MAG: polyprenyl diphosphate synthase, partial [Clostridiales bacterium]|nr:polyprenyl diphosphate synthase [Clostridiales bacterium]